MYEEKGLKIYLIEAENTATSVAIGKFSNEKLTNFKLFNLSALADRRVCAIGFSKGSINKLPG